MEDLGGAGEVGGGGVGVETSRTQQPLLLKFYSCPTRKSSVFFTSEIKKKRLDRGTQLLVND